MTLELLFIIIGQADTPPERGGVESADDDVIDDVCGTLVGNVVDLSRNIYLIKRTADNARVMICERGGGGRQE